MSTAYDLVVLGLGSAGLTAVDVALRLGVRVAAVEPDRVGGDCLWTGCVPSKALLAAARTAHTLRTADRFGLPASDAPIDTAAVLERLRGVRDDIARTDDNPELLESRGVDVVVGRPRVVAPDGVVVDTEVGERHLTTRAVLICTGSHPVVPELPGIEDVDVLTNASLFELERLPSSLVIIGGGPVGVELAQATRRLGTTVTLVEQGPHLLPRDEPGLTGPLADVLRAEGVDVRTDTTVTRLIAEERGGRAAQVELEGGGRTERVATAAVLVAVGHAPNLAGLGLEDLGVAVNADGIVVDDKLATSVPGVYAAGDVAGRHHFTHAAGYEAAIAVRNALLPLGTTADATVPWCTFTDPELAHVGVTEAEARASFGRKVRTWRRSLAHSDRGRTDDTTVGEIVLVTVGSKLVGAHVLAPAAGEVINELAVAMAAGLPVHRLASVVHVYPTIGVGVQQSAAESLFGLAAKAGWLARRRRRR